MDQWNTRQLCLSDLYCVVVWLCVVLCVCVPHLLENLNSDLNIGVLKRIWNSPAHFSAQSPYFGINECVAPPPYLSSNHRPWCCGTEGCMSHRHLWRTHTSRDVSSQHAAATGRCRFSVLVKWVALEDTESLWDTLFIRVFQKNTFLTNKLAEPTTHQLWG